MVKTFKSWGPSFKVEFDIKVTKLPRRGWHNRLNVFHFHGRYGSGIPGLWIGRMKDRQYFCISSAVKTMYKRFKYKSYTKFVVGKKYHITIQQLKVSGNYYYEIIIDGASKFKILNTMAKQYYNVKMYASDPWHPAFTSHFGWISAIKTQQSKKSKGT